MVLAFAYFPIFSTYLLTLVLAIKMYICYSMGIFWQFMCCRLVLAFLSHQKSSPLNWYVSNYWNLCMWNLTCLSVRYKRNAMIKKYVYTDIIRAWKHAPSSYTYATTYTYMLSLFCECFFQRFLNVSLLWSIASVCKRGGTVPTDVSL